jgi:cobalt-zinc-cadmium efflux system outer membrane protein
MFLITGCAQVPKDAGFDDVKGIVDERTEYKVHWIRGKPEDEAAMRAVEGLLSEELTVDAAVQIALLNNPSIQAVYEELGITQADVVQAGLLKNPVFFGSARFPNEPPSGTNLEFEVVQDFLDILMLPARKRLSETQFEKTKLHVAGEVIRLVAEVKKAYYEALGMEQTKEIQRLYAHAAQAAHEMARRLHRAGNMRELRMARERYLYESARIALAKTEADRLASRERLSSLMGLWGDQTGWRVPQRLPGIPEIDPTLEHLESVAVSNRLDLAAAKKEVDFLAQAMGIVLDWRWFGSAEIGVSAERDTDGQRVIGPTLSFEIPIFDQGQAKISRLEAQFR